MLPNKVPTGLADGLGLGSVLRRRVADAPLNSGPPRPANGARLRPDREYTPVHCFGGFDPFGDVDAFAGSDRFDDLEREERSDGSDGFDAGLR
jgi:hypothetical protein